MLEQLFLTLFLRSLTAGILILAILILRPLLFRVSRAACCVLWWFVAFRLLCPVSIPSKLSLFGMLPDVEQSATAVTPVGDDTLIWQLIPDAVQGDTAVESHALSFTEIFSVLWVIGAVLLVLFWAFSYLRMRNRSRYAIRHNGGYWQCDAINSPMVFGMIHPRILIPFDIEEADIPYILAHEQSHVSRRDHRTKPLAFLLVAVYWFNPLVWLAYVLYCKDIEFACDAKALRLLGATNNIKTQYTRVLLRSSIRRQDRFALALPFGGHEVKHRLKFALSYRKPKFAAMLLVAVLFTAMAVCFLTDPIARAEFSAPIASETPSLPPVDESVEESQFEATSEPATVKQPEETGDVSSEPEVSSETNDNVYVDSENQRRMVWTFSEVADYFIIELGYDPEFIVNWIFRAVKERGYVLVVDVNPDEYLDQTSEWYQKRVEMVQKRLAASEARRTR